MIIVQVILLAAVAFLFLVALRSRSAHSADAWKKMAFVALMVVVVIAVLAPGLVSTAANLVGVGRGTDLVLYLVSVTFGFYVVNQYLRGQESRDQLHQLARRIAVLEALERYGMERSVVRDRTVTAESPAGDTEPGPPA
ncbi:hypothetical protein ASG88_02115 [Nocardioides sp. Soil777]|uniref:DUF2304 domain-containing protein n=1 Tax=Nocardioides sp. Soil777 TaxID=1736409 RepID=UPI0007033B11|nr:DUF2304 domain-containing protein [Nocardioides sp. Soil777]KRF07644.1 hypothetical protein ASG88_02115 [Nocardioides sp. Soil777]